MNRHRGFRSWLLIVAGSFLVASPFPAQPAAARAHSIDRAPSAVQAGRPAVAAATTTDPVIAAAGDIACDPLSGGYNGGNGTATDCREKYTASLLSGANAVLALGDEQYACGGLSAFGQSYDPSWGQQKAITYPVPGNHEYQTSGGTGCSTNAAGYYTYFGSAAGDPTKGYQSFNLGSWHIIALNSECAQIGGCSSGSPEEVWLRGDLAANSSAQCTLAYWHRPRFASVTAGGDATYDQFWKDLYAAHADVVLNGHMHWYERFALQNPSAQADPNGIREFIVGTGGASYTPPAATAVNSEVLHWGTYGVLKMTLHPGSYDWAFVPDTGSAGGTFTDSGSTGCHGAPAGTDSISPTTTSSCNGTVCQGPYTDPVTVSLSATDNTGGSGVDKTYYTTDGSTPTTASPVYTGPFSVSGTTTVRFFSTDLAGNQEQVKSQLIRIDQTAPTVTLTRPQAGASFKKGSKVLVAADAADLGSGSAASGVASVTFYVDGTTALGTVTVSAYQVSWNTGSVARGNHTLTAVARDVAGNSSTSAALAVKIT